MQTLINSQRYQKLDPEGRGRNREITETEQRIAVRTAGLGAQYGITAAKEMSAAKGRGCATQAQSRHGHEAGVQVVQSSRHLNDFSPWCSFGTKQSPAWSSGQAILVLFSRTIGVYGFLPDSRYAHNKPPVVF